MSPSSPPAEFFAELRKRVAEKAKGRSADKTDRTLRAEFHTKRPAWDQLARLSVGHGDTAKLP